MRFIRPGAFIALGLCFADAAGAQAASDLRVALMAHMETAERDGFAGTVLVDRGGQVILHQSYGLADRERQVPVSNQTVFDVGSITKQFTRAGILLLRDRGRLSLTDSLGRFFPAAPLDKRGITLEQVIGMRAGLAEYIDRPGEAGDFAAVDRAEALRRILGEPLQFAPGTDRAYSNAGYTLLALIIEQVAAQPYEAFVREHLLSPAGLDRSGFYADQARWREQDVAIGYGGRTHGRNSPYHWPEAQWALVGNGGLVSNPAELYRWIRTLRAGRVLSAASFRDLYGGSSPLSAAPAGANPISYAGGSDFGFQSVVFELYDAAGIVIVSTNTGGVMPVARGLVNILQGRTVTAEPRPVADGGPARWGIPGSPRGQRVAALLDMVAAGTEEAARHFVATSMAPVFRDAFPMREHLSVLSELQQTLRDPEVAGLMVEPPNLVKLQVKGRESGVEVVIEMELDEAFRIAGMRIGSP